MKKVIISMLMLMLCFSMTACGSGCYIEWFDVDDVVSVEPLDKERFVLLKEYDEWHKICALFSYDGKALTDFNYSYITKLTDKLYSGRSYYFLSGNDGTTDALDFEGNIIERQRYILAETNSVVIPGKTLQPNIAKLRKNGATPVSIWGYFAVVRKDDYMALTDLEGNLLSEFDYINFDLSNMYSGKIILYAKNNEYILIADGYNNRYFEKVVAMSRKVFPKSFIYLNENNKYAIAKMENLEIIAEEYDEFIGVMHNNYTFKKNGMIYTTDEFGNIGYTGDKLVRKEAYNNYVVEENEKFGIVDDNFNEIFPCEYEDIDIIAEDLYILKKDGTSKLISQGKEILSSDTGMSALCRYIATNSKLYDYEGNYIIDETWKFGVDAGYDFVIYDEKTKHAGRLVSENCNPLIEIDNEFLYSDTLPRIKNDITLIPLRAFAEKAGFETEYEENTKEIKLISDGKEIIFRIGEKTAKANGEEIRLEAAPEITNNRTLVPARSVSDVFGFYISWDGNRRLVSIKTK